MSMTVAQAQSALLPLATQTPGEGPKLRSTGDRDETVEAIQHALRSYGFGTQADGVFGPQTRAHVMAFQRRFGLKVDGIVGPETARALRSGGGVESAVDGAHRQQATHLTSAPSPAPGPTSLPAPAPASGPRAVMSLPPRDANALGGHAIMEAMARKSQTEREAYIIAQVKAGNIPPHMRELEPVTVRDPDGSARTIYTLPDFIGVGSDDDFVRVPLSVPAAQAIAQHLGGRLPERAEVDAIYEQAGATLPFSNRTPDHTMATVPVMVEHNDYLERIRRERGIVQGTLIEGHKKTVMAPRRKGEVTIYGWHGDRPAEGQRPRPGRGEAIQPYQTPHGEMHADYSHGVRVIFDRPATPGVVTLPEVTIVGDRDAPDEPESPAPETKAPASEPASSASGIDGASAAEVAGAAAAAAILGPAAPLAAMAYRWLRRDDD